VSDAGEWRLSLVRRREGLDRDRFVAHWLGPHREHVSGIDGVLETRFFVVRSWTPDEVGWDGLGLIRFPDGERARAAFDDPALRAWVSVERACHFGRVENAFLSER
jgi:hypothetical protein